MTAPNPAFLCRFAVDITLAAGVAQSVDLPINGAHNWLAVVKNTGGANAITAMTVASSPLGTLFEDASSVTSGIPITPGSAICARGTNEPATTVRLTLTSTSGTTVSIEAGGW